jgi:hypothetical protein
LDDVDDGIVEADAADAEAPLQSLDDVDDGIVEADAADAEAPLQSLHRLL